MGRIQGKAIELFSNPPLKELEVETAELYEGGL